MINVFLPGTEKPCMTETRDCIMQWKQWALMPILSGLLVALTSIDR